MRPRPLTDQSVYGKLTRGDPLTAEDFALILDGNSIENVVKLKYENLEINAALDEYFKEKAELKEAALENTLQGIIEYITWQQEQDALIAKEKYKLQEADLKAFNLEDEKPVLDSYVEKGWLSKLIENLFPDNYSSHMKSSIEEASEHEKRAIKAVFLLAIHSATIRAFIFPKQDPTTLHDKKLCQQHCKLMMERILCVGSTLEHIHGHKLMSNAELTKIVRSKIQQNEDQQLLVNPRTSRL